MDVQNTCYSLPPLCPIASHFCLTLKSGLHICIPSQIKIFENKVFGHLTEVPDLMISTIEGMMLWYNDDNNNNGNNIPNNNNNNNNSKNNLLYVNSW